MKLRTNHNSHLHDAWAWPVAPLAIWMFVASSTSCFAESIQKTSRDADVVLTVTASASSVQVAEPLNIEWKVTAPDGFKVSFPVVGDQLGEWDVTSHSDAFDVPSQDGRLWIRTLTLETIQTGEIVIPSIEILYIASGGDAASTRSISSKLLILRIASMLEESSDLTKFRDIRSVVDVPIPKNKSMTNWSRAASVIGSVVACTVLGYVIVVARRRRPRITARQWALKEIDSLRKRLTPSNRVRARSFCRNFQISCENTSPSNLGFSSMQTTEELLAQVTKINLISVESSLRISEVLVTADQTKFAGLKLVDDQLACLVKQTREAILEPPFIKEGV